MGYLTILYKLVVQYEEQYCKEETHPQNIQQTGLPKEKLNSVKISKRYTVGYVLEHFLKAHRLYGYFNKSKQVCCSGSEEINLFPDKIGLNNAEMLIFKTGKGKRAKQALF